MKKYWVMLILVFSLLPGALCIASTYTDLSPANHLWENSGNWESNNKPALNDDAEMTEDGTICEVVASDDIECRGVFIGCYGADNRMYMTGGELTCQWLNVGRGSDPNGTKGKGTFIMTGGTINALGEFKIPNQFGSAGNSFTIADANMVGGTINISTENFVIGDRIHGADGGGYGELDMKADRPGKPPVEIRIDDGRVIDPDDPDGPGLPGLAETGILEGLFNGYITATTYTDNASAMVVVDANEARTILRVEETTAQQAYDPMPGSWFTDEYTISSQTTNLDWTSVPGLLYEFLYFSDDESLVASKDSSVETNVTSASRPYSVGSLEAGKTYYWQIVTQIIMSKYDGQIWRLRVPNSVQVDDFDDSIDGYSVTWTDGGSAVSSKEDNAGLRYSPYGKNLMIAVGTGLSGSVYSTPAGSDWTVKNVKGLYVDVYGNELNDPNVTLTLTLNDTADVTYTGSLQDVYDTVTEARFTWKIPVEDFGISMDNITKIAFTVDNTLGAVDAVVHVADIRLVAEECLNQPEADISGDCIVDLDDVKMVAIDWLTSGLGLPE